VILHAHPRIVPCLWFDRDAEAAVRHYSAIFPRSRTTATSHYGEGAPLPAGTVLTIAFELDGQPFMALNGGPHEAYTDALSLQVMCDTQAEIDHYWERLAAGGRPVQCGWLKDRWGVSWQVVPRMVLDIIGGSDAARSQRVLQAVQGMVKLDIAALQAAADGRGA